MPIFYVNENLISEELQHTSTWQKTGEQYERWMIKTNGLERRAQDGSFERADRVICVHNLGQNPGDRTRIVATKFAGEEQFPAKVTIRTSGDTRYDTEIFIVAIPYDGIVMPVEPSDNLNIYKFTINKSDRMSFQMDDRKYKRCIYAVVVPDATIVGTDGFYPASSDLVIRTAVSNFTPQQGEPDPAKHHWTVTTRRVRFGHNGIYEIEVNEETVNYDAINPAELHKATLCQLVEPVILEPRDGGYQPSREKKSVPAAQQTVRSAPEPDAGLEKTGKKRRRRRHKKSGISGISN